MFKLDGYLRTALLRATIALLLVACLVTGGAAAEKRVTLPGDTVAQPRAASGLAYDDPLGRSTPHGTVLGFVRSAVKKDYERALQYLDTNKRGASAEKLIDTLEQILERGFSGKLATLSNKPEGDLDDGLLPSRDRVGTATTASGSFDIILERVERKSQPPVWLFSADTLAKVPDYYDEPRTGVVETYLPRALVDTWVLWFPLWQWLLFLLLIPLSFVLATLATRLLVPLLSLLVRRVATVRGHDYVTGLTGPLRILIFALAIWSISLLSRSVLSSFFWAYVATTLTVIGATWVCVRAIDLAFSLKQQQMALASPADISVLQLARRLSKIVMVIAGGLVILYLAGVNLTAVLTGLGVGGIAIAFAAQKTLENLFGGIMIASDRPLRVGDFCRVGEYTGTVEDVGLRSTRIRTLDRSVVAVPNGQLAMMNIENFTLRDSIWFNHTLQLRYETTADQLRYILARTRTLLYEHPKVDSATARVRFVGFAQSSLNLQVFAYVFETEHPDFLKVQEDLLLRIMEIVEESGSSLAFPSQTTYVTRDAGLDAKKSQQAAATVRQWREQGELPFPDFSSEKIAEINDSLEYPPPYSAQRKKNDRK